MEKKKEKRRRKTDNSWHTLRIIKKKEMNNPTTET